MPSLTTVAMTSSTDKYRERGCVPFVSPALELPVDGSSALSLLLAHKPLAWRTPLDYLHMVRTAVLCAPCARFLPAAVT
jgi:hypothetical protein